MDYSLTGCSVHRILQAKILEWVAIWRDSKRMVIESQGESLRGNQTYWHFDVGLPVFRAVKK